MYNVLKAEIHHNNEFTQNFFEHNTINYVNK